MSGLPWSKFFWSDYASDPALKLCSFAAQGLWMRMLCIAAEHDPPGYVAVNGNPLDNSGIARMTGGSINEVESLVAEMERNGVFTRDRRGWIYSRRQINESKRRDKLSQWGKMGGNPILRKQTDNSAGDKPNDKPEDKAASKPHIPEARVQSKKTPSESKKIAMPKGWNPEPFGDDSDSAKIVGEWTPVELKRQIESFKAHHISHGSKFVNWQKAWSTWVLNSERFKANGNAQRQAPDKDDYLKYVVEHVIPELEAERQTDDAH